MRHCVLALPSTRTVWPSCVGFCLSFLCLFFVLRWHLLRRAPAATVKVIGIIIDEQRVCPVVCADGLLVDQNFVMFDVLPPCVPEEEEMNDLFIDLSMVTIYYAY